MTVRARSFSAFPYLLIAALAVLFGAVSGVPQESLPIDSLFATDSTISTTTQVPIASASDLRVVDTPDDAGGSLDLLWELSKDDFAGGTVTTYQVRRGAVVGTERTPPIVVGDVPAGQSSFHDGQADDDTTYYYQVVAMSRPADTTQPGRESSPIESSPVISKADWFDNRRINVFVGVLLLSGFIVFYISQARRGKELFIRKIAGLEAVDEAVGRATEMGKKIYYIPGSQDMDNVQTIAGVTILGRVAEMAAQYETHLEVPVSRSLVMVTCREVMKEAYAKAGRPDAFKEDNVHYLTDDQFGYAAAIDGMVVRERPAAIFLMGSFYAESLILAETGNSVGAIQIAGTGQPSQLPFFVAACDYTLIGEELFAASAYLSREPRQLGSLKGQDVGKGVILVAIVIGVLLETFGLWDFSRLFSVIE